MSDRYHPQKSTLMARQIHRERIDNISDMLWRETEMDAFRATSTEVRDADVEMAYRRLIRPSRISTRINLLISFGVYATAIPLGLAINWLAADLRDGKAWALLCVSAALGLALEVIRHLAGRR